MRRTKIIATLGPASSSPEMIEKLSRAGVDIFRLNLSHGDQETHKKTLKRIRALEKTPGVHTCVMIDLQGPKIRVGQMPENGMPLTPGQTVTVVAKDTPGGGSIIPTVYKNLPKDVKPGDTILINDGFFELKVKSVRGAEVTCAVVRGGVLTSHKGINLPGVAISVPSITKKDVEDLRFALDLGVDYVAMSFVRSETDVTDLKKMIRRFGGKAAVIAKIERPEALGRLSHILHAADGVMVARGDLGVEMPPEKVPEIQKMIIEEANHCGKRVITATQMLESMISSARPTRAEASDVANAVYDGTDCVMLSGETSTGKYPVEAVEMMVRIVFEAERRVMKKPMFEPSTHLLEAAGFSGAVAHASVRVARELNAKAVFTFTQSGTTALLCSKYRPACRIIGATLDRRVASAMRMYWGVTPLLMDSITSMESLVGDVDKMLLKTKLARRGDVIVITSGVPIGKSGTTNLLKIHHIGESD